MMAETNKQTKGKQTLQRKIILQIGVAIAVQDTRCC
jgi:hypothetical protein